MGQVQATARLQRLLDMGFSVTESRLALEATGGDVERAAALLLERRAAAANRSFAERINAILREQRPWSEFFERFLWPEHLDERVRTNLMYYRANYMVLCCAALVISLLVQPAMLLVVILVAALFTWATAFGDGPLPGVDIELSAYQRIGVASTISAVLLNASGFVVIFLQLLLLCTGLVLAHATFRARSISSRFKFFQQQMKGERSQ